MTYTVIYCIGILYALDSIKIGLDQPNLTHMQHKTNTF